MHEFAESVLREIKQLERDTEELVLNGSITSMERYRFLMGRLEGIRIVLEIVRDKVQKHTD